jgi:hypothetical protein
MRQPTVLPTWLLFHFRPPSQLFSANSTQTALLARPIVMQSARVAYIHSQRLEQLADVGTYPQGRSSVVHALVRCSGLVGDVHCPSLSTATVVAPTPATRDDLLSYHSQDFVGAIM